MSAWFVMSALGLYAVDPVSGTYVLTAPLFDRARVRTGPDSELVITVSRQSPGDRYIRGVSLNGRHLDELWVNHSDLVDGGSLHFVLTPEPDFSFATSEDAMPPSSSDERAIYKRGPIRKPPSSA